MINNILTFLFRLIDFGRAINNRAVAPTVPFTGVCYTSNFSCPQMHTKSEWRYQVWTVFCQYSVLNIFNKVDLYALGMSLHVIMFGDYSKIDPKTIKDGSFSFQRIVRDLLLNGGTISRPLKPIPMSKVISDKKPLS